MKLCANINTLLSLYDRHNFNVILLLHGKPFRSTLESIDVDQWDQMLAPLQILRDVAFDMGSQSVQPFKIIYWSLRLLSSSLCSESNSPIPLTPCHRRARPKTFICTGCLGCNLDIRSSLTPNKALVLNPKRLVGDCVEIGFSTVLEYWHHILFGMDPSLTSYHNLRTFFLHLVLMIDDGRRISIGYLIFTIHRLTPYVMVELVVGL